MPAGRLTEGAVELCSHLHVTVSLDVAADLFHLEYAWPHGNGRPSRAPLYATKPPSTGVKVPVMKLAAGETSQSSG